MPCPDGPLRQLRRGTHQYSTYLVVDQVQHSDAMASSLRDVGLGCMQHAEVDNSASATMVHQVCSYPSAVMMPSLATAA
jgi:hypothetical protein